MPRRPDVPCADCGTLMWRGTGSLPPGAAMCRDCRRKRPGYRARAPHTPTLQPCKTCGQMFETKQSTHLYCRTECRPKRSGASRPSRLTTPQRGYGYQHQRQRQAWAVTVEAGQADCSLCHDPIAPDAEWDLDHTEDRTAYRGPAHRECNRRDGQARRQRAA